ncbi:MAG: sodium ion-translocating decarboxylase subunit beta [Candidatus Enteromonas sp.]|nr:sodium ion-translocating decarboxylase subunit beta [bacterium]MDD6917222.1 sodium ion-translocating decarboxylase subunit beta [bacterium]MDY6100974.1 sodium ion-translocating decarboxylase subunit beta [Candidatus Enteromonas sp.]
MIPALSNNLGDFFLGFWNSTGISAFFSDGGWKNLIMIAIACLLLYLAIWKKAEPYLLIPMGIGMLLVNLPLSGIFETSYVDMAGNALSAPILKEVHYSGLLGLVYPNGEMVVDTTQCSATYSGLLGTLYYGIKFEIYPCLIFMGIGATTDFGPLISNPKTMLLGAAAQLGIFLTFMLAIPCGFTPAQAGSIGIIGGADGPTAILTTTKLAPELLSSIAIAAYSYMALVPFIQPPVIRLLTTKKERRIHMEMLKPVSKTKKILFPIIVTILVTLLVPSCAPLIGCLMFGNLIKESGVVPKLVENASNSLLYIVTILLGLTVGATATAANFLNVKTLLIFGLGIVAFVFATAGGVLLGKLMCWLTHGKVNPMIGAAGVSAVPMAARVVQKEGVREDPSNFLLMHAMGPNVAGVIGSAVAAGLLIFLLG